MYGVWCVDSMVCGFVFCVRYGVWCMLWSVVLCVVSWYSEGMCDVVCGRQYMVCSARCAIRKVWYTECGKERDFLNISCNIIIIILEIMIEIILENILNLEMNKNLYQKIK